MEYKKIKDIENVLLNRKEIQLVLQSDSNPEIGNLKTEVSKDFKTSEENIVINRVKGKFGRDTFLIDAFIYKTLEDLNKIKLRKKIKKVGGK